MSATIEDDPVRSGCDALAQTLLHLRKQHDGDTALAFARGALFAAVGILTRELGEARVRELLDRALEAGAVVDQERRVGLQ
jgi:hypothetical protein